MLNELLKVYIDIVKQGRCQGFRKALDNNTDLAVLVVHHLERVAVTGSSEYSTNESGNTRREGYRGTIERDGNDSCEFSSSSSQTQGVAEPSQRSLRGGVSLVFR